MINILVKAGRSLLAKLLIASGIVYIAAAGVWLAVGGIVGAGSHTELLNVSYDPTRELWRELNDAFIAHYKQSHGVDLHVRQSHGGSASQARAVIDGLA